MQRQAINVSIKELRKIADDLEKESKEQEEEFGIKSNLDIKWILSIINKTKESDTWKFEK